MLCTRALANRQYCRSRMMITLAQQQHFRRTGTYVLLSCLPLDSHILLLCTNDGGDGLRSRKVRLILKFLPPTSEVRNVSSGTVRYSYRWMDVVGGNTYARALAQMQSVDYTRARTA